MAAHDVARLVLCISLLLPLASCADIPMVDYFAQLVRDALKVQCEDICNVFDFEEDPKEYERASMATVFNEFLDTENVLHITRSSFTRDSRRVGFVDVGAKLGDTIEDLIAVFGRQHSRPLIIYAFEPNPESAKVIASKIEKEEFHKIHLVQAAVLNSIEHAHTEDGKVNFIHRGEGDDIGSVNPYVSYIDGRERYELVDIVVLDTFFKSGFTIHLLKIDVEGYDPWVLQGATRLLLRKQIKFITFEFNLPLWKRARHGIRLDATVAELYSHGMLCFIITRAGLVPAYGDWWQESFSAVVWANLFCGSAGDHDLYDAYVAYGTDNRTMSWALANLRVSQHRTRWWH